MMMLLPSLDHESQVLVRFRVYGLPMPAGSKVAFVNRDGKARLKESNEVPHVSWRNAVASAAYEVAETLDGPLDGPLGLEATFRFPMPATRRVEIRRRGLCHKTTAPDTDKLVRSISDSMEAARLITNDARFAVVFANKVEVREQWIGAEITIRRLT